MEAFGPSKIGTKYPQEMLELIKLINKAIEEESHGSIKLIVDSTYDKYEYRIKDIYTKAGWAEVEWNKSYNDDNDITIILRRSYAY